MRNPDFPDTSLLLIGHGSTVNDDSTASVQRCADSLRRLGSFAEVQVAFWKVEPLVQGALARTAGRRVVVVPCFVSEGYFTEEAIPQALGLRRPGEAIFSRRQELLGREVIYTRPLGTHPCMTEVILDCARGVVGRFPFPHCPREADLALFVVGHGTERNAESRRAVERHAEQLRAKGIFRQVEAAFMLEEPRIEKFASLTAARGVVVVPFFMSDGLHVAEDLPVLLGETPRVVQERLVRGMPAWRNPSERSGKRIWCSGSVGTASALVQVVLERVHEALGWAA